ncbi:hypothetical protein [Sulfurisphaera ohwakuensis]|uniref:Putative membrane protein YfcA n=1 Tax=Sulfurisphaera ohwakuensis TaxID=69656 RepID=A0A650CFX6_SULOH|nr:hypothetical protein [Sulfurisphaera ohwakuensis]MBB5255035.1 putative membrane protein YfcA [Sulfurisphaera ohwakuensis]QGR16575.1 hypothetical protein D1869_04720 [Sulfurisphaera ohwakuensis]
MVIKKKGLSEVVGFFILLIILLAVLIPLGIYMFSQPTIQTQSAESANSYKNLATEQFRDFQPVVFNAGGFAVAPVYFIYQDGNVYFVFVNKQNPPVTLVIKALEVFNGKTWVTQPVNVVVSTSYATTTFAGFPAIQITLKESPYNNQASYVAAVTQYGNIIYASPPYVLPIAKLIKPLGIASINPYNFSIIEEPGFQQVEETSDCVPLVNFIHSINGPYSNTMTFLGDYLTGNKSLPFSYEGYWFGPIAYPSQSSQSPPSFKGIMKGIFVGANFTFAGANDGYFTGSLGSSQGYPIYFTNGKAESATFNNSFILGSISGVFSGSIIIPGGAINNYFLATSNQLSVTLKGEEGTYYIANVTGSITFNGKFNGYVNGMHEYVDGNNKVINGMINNGTLTGEIISATFTPGYVTVQQFGIAQQQYVNGYINVSNTQISITANGISNLLGQLVAAPIISGTFTNAVFSNAMANSPTQSAFLLFPSPFNVTLNDYVGNLTLSNNHAVGEFNGEIVFPQNQYALSVVAVSDFDGYINGVFSGGYDYLLGGFLSPVTLSVIESNASVLPAYSFPLFSKYEYNVLSPLVIKVQVAIGNPSNVTLEFTKVQVAMKAEGILQLIGQSATPAQPFSATLYGSVEDELNKPIIVTPLNVSNFTLYLTVPINSVFSSSQIFPPSSNQQYEAIESFTVDYIELYLTFVEPNGYGITVSTVIPPYYIPVSGEVNS